MAPMIGRSNCENNLAFVQTNSNKCSVLQFHLNNELKAVIQQAPIQNQQNYTIPDTIVQRKVILENNGNNNNNNNNFNNNNNIFTNVFLESKNIGEYYYKDTYYDGYLDETKILPCKSNYYYGKYFDNNFYYENEYKIENLNNDDEYYDLESSSIVYVNSGSKYRKISKFNKKRKKEKRKSSMPKTPIACVHCNKITPMHNMNGNNYNNNNSNVLIDSEEKMDGILNNSNDNNNNKNNNNNNLTNYEKSTFSYQYLNESDNNENTNDFSISSDESKEYNTVIAEFEKSNNISKIKKVKQKTIDKIVKVFKKSYKKAVKLTFKRRNWAIMKNHFHWYKRNLLKKLKYDIGDNNYSINNLFFKIEINCINKTADEMIKQLTKDINIKKRMCNRHWILINQLFDMKKIKNEKNTIHHLRVFRKEILKEIENAAKEKLLKNIKKLWEDKLSYIPNIINMIKIDVRKCINDDLLNTVIYRNLRIEKNSIKTKLFKKINSVKQREKRNDEFDQLILQQYYKIQPKDYALSNNGRKVIFTNLYQYQKLIKISILYELNKMEDEIFKYNKNQTRKKQKYRKKKWVKINNTEQNRKHKKKIDSIGDENMIINNITNETNNYQERNELQANNNDFYNDSDKKEEKKEKIANNVSMVNKQNKIEHEKEKDLEIRKNENINTIASDETTVWNPISKFCKFIINGNNKVKCYLDFLLRFENTHFK